MCLGIPGKVIEIHEQDSLPMGKVEFGGITKDICLAYVPEAQVGDYVLVHAGFAISIIDEDDAQETLSYIEQIQEFSEIDRTETVGSPASIDSEPEGTP
ncbi:MAG: HypC/HybG/HupF family hydrogenase formation chaperone [Planctomycetes bacterium]|nr:HypC/HybG/HupF family hydrogenase formation chaperone [Planctomycetota bacterium]MBL7037404.1 HypC/HybG/HupF family hydrogenase formation chaperone [Pirellulaceae bacterium]